MTVSHTVSRLETEWQQQEFPLHSLSTSWLGATAVGVGRQSFHQGRQKLAQQTLQDTHHAPETVGKWWDKGWSSVLHKGALLGH